jgi:hypothetical protein
MSDRESRSPLREASPRSSASSSDSRSTGHLWWWHRHLHVPVVVWIVASVLGGAAIGNALEPDGTSDPTPPPAEVVSEPLGATGCDENAVDVDVDADAAADADVDRPSYVAEPMYGLGSDRDVIVCD